MPFGSLKKLKRPHRDLQSAARGGDRSAESSADLAEAGIVALGTSLELLRERFNRDRDTKRLVAVLSPSCSGCLRAVDGLEALLGEEALDQWSLHIVWGPFLPTDDETATVAVVCRIVRPNFHHYYDANLLTAIALDASVFPGWLAAVAAATPEDHALFATLAQAAKQQNARGQDARAPLWDVAFLYPAGLEWLAGPPPRPEGFTKQVAFYRGRGENTGYFLRDRFDRAPFESDWIVELRAALVED